MSRDDSNFEKLSPLKRAFLALEEAQSKLKVLERRFRQPIAIVGTGCRIPGGVADAQSYWDLLCKETDTIREVPADRWDIDAYFDPDPDTPGKMASRWGGFLDDISQFDPGFFAISPREASRMDPQQRLLLEVAWEALENAAQSPSAIWQTKTGVYFGICSSDYLHLALAMGDMSLLDAHLAAGTAHSIASGRVSYLLGLHGPSLSIDTACSSSLVAVHQACTALLAGDCDMALAGGVNAIVAPETTTSLSHARFLAPDGRCKAFDAAADGFVRSEGCAIVVLKRLADAAAAGDRILAVIRGTALNQDGPSSSLTAPNGRSQESVIREALANAGVAPEEVSYVETHGTGTSLGDPIEVEALGRVLAEKERRSVPLAIGSVKTNVGHLEAAAGVAGLIKVVLALQHRQIPAHLHLQQRSEHIAWERYAIEIPTALQAWEGVGGRRIAGVSSFGFSGTNAHVVVEQAPEPEVADNPVERPWHVLTVSAKSEAALEEMAAAYAERLRGADEDRLADLCYTANVGRAHFGQRLSVAGATREEMARKLAGGEGAVRGAVGAQTRPRVAFLFTGQGSQYVGMGRQLYEGSPRFRATLQRCETLLRGKLGRGLLEVMFAGSAEELERTENTQPALFALEYALAELWRSWGVEPAAVLGHSVGEYVAACVAGVFSLEDGLELIAERGRLMREEPGGGEMAAVMAPEERVRGEAAGYAGISIAAVNGPGNVVVSGGAEEVESLCGRLQESGVRSRRLQVSHAFHSQRMDGVIGRLEAAAGRVRMQKPRVRLVSNVSGKVAGEEVREAGYWGRHTRETVQFARGMETLRELGCEVMLEVGPAAVLSGMGQECLGREGLVWAASLRKNGGEDWKQAGAAVQALYAAGVEIDWAGWDGDYRRRKAALPTYRFQRQRYWIRGLGESRRGRNQMDEVHPLLGEEQGTPLAARQFEAELRAGKPEWIADHRIGGRVLLPATGYLEMALAAGRELWNGAEGAVEDVALPQAMVLEEETGRRVQTIVEAEGDHEARWRIFSADSTGREWRLHASGRLRRLDAAAEAEPGETLEQIRARCGELVEAGPFYELLRSRGLEFGEGFRGIQAIHRGQGEALVEVRLPETLRADAKRYRIHPVLLDACIQGLGSTIPPDSFYLPMGIESVRVMEPVAEACWSHVRLLARADADTLGGVVRVFTADGTPAAEISGMQFKRIERDQIARSQGARIEQWLYESLWRPAAKARAPAKTGAGRGWLVFADNGQAGAQIADELRRAGSPVAVIRRPEHCPAADWYAGVLQSAASTAPLAGVIHLWSLDGAGPGEEAEPDKGLEACRSAVHLAQTMLKASVFAAVPLWVVTRGAQPVERGGDVSAPMHSTIWGLARTIRLEHPDFRITCVDLDPAAGTGGAGEVLSELGMDGCDEVGYRGSERYVARIASAKLPEIDRDANCLTLDISRRGTLDGTVIAAAERIAPGPGEVQIRMEAAGLNFRDVINLMGLYPGDAGPLGIECTGTVAAAGEGVDEFRPGDRVVAVAGKSFSTYVNANAAFVAHRPHGFTATEAATIPIAFMTAEFCLHEVAGLGPNDRVLIHAAAGGVGLAAVQLALRTGAEVFATAGSDEKRQYLKALGVPHVMNSRTHDFAGEIMRATGGKGVTCVLNSLMGEFIPRSLEVVEPGGWFVEIGKRDVWSEEQVAALGRGIRYAVVDWWTTAQEDPARIAAILRRLLAKFQSGELKPLPARAFPFQGAPEAFRFMAQARHTGKIVLRSASAAPAGEIRADATYLISGGLGAMGLVIANWMVQQGARNLVLFGRSCPAPKVEKQIAEWEQQGIRLLVRQADVCDRQQVRALLSAAAEQLPPIRGVVHCAGSLDDGMFINQEWARFRNVLTSKVDGAWNLHLLTQELPLEFFVLSSSAASLFGSKGQASYAAGNAFLDGLAHYRRARGLRALSLDWGAWGDVGMVVRSGVDKRAAAQGLGIMPIEGALTALGLLMRSGPPQMGVIPIDWPRFLARLAPAPSLFCDKLAETQTVHRVPAHQAGVEADGLVRRLQSAMPAKRLAVLRKYIEEQVRRVLDIAPDQLIQVNRPLNELGLDSLMAVELRNVLASATAKPLPATTLFDYPTIEALSAYLLREVLGMGPAEAKPQPVGKDDLLSELEQLSDDEADQLLSTTRTA